MKLQNKIILITGASSGIGQAIAIETAKQKAVVLIHYRKNSKGAQETLEQIKQYSKGDTFSADLTKPNSVKQLFQDIKNKGYKTIDGLVNNAGEAISGEFDDIELWNQQLNNIFLSQVYTSNEFIKFTTHENLRKIVNTSSVYGILEMGNPDFVHYSAAKAAVNSFTMTLAKKYAPHILINAVAPGYTWTPPWEGTSEEEKKLCVDLTKIGRFVKPEEIAAAVIALLQNDAITGEIVRVDGGLHLLNLR